MILYTFVLFFLLTPGVLISLPPKGSITVVALTHALVFTLLMSLTHHLCRGDSKGNSPAGIKEATIESMIKKKNGSS